MNPTPDVRRIFNSVSEIWLLLDIRGNVVLTSKRLNKFRDLMAEPIVEGSYIFDCVPERWRQMARNVFDGVHVSPVPSIFEATHKSDDGKETHYEIKCTGIVDETGNLAEVFVEARDVTPQKIFERKITIVARDYQNLIENANAVIIGTDARGYITEWNEMARQVTGYSKNELYSQQLTDFVSPEAEDACLQAMGDILHGRVIANYEMALVAKDKRRLTLLINGTPRPNAAGEVVGILLIGQDITELSAYRHSLEQKVWERTNALRVALDNEKKLVEVKDRFVSMASHEFRSPISYIHRNIGAIKEKIDSLSADEVRERLDKIQSQAAHLTSLLEDVLTMGKTGANTNRIQANLSSLDFKEFLCRIIDEVVTNTHGTHNVALDFPFPKLHFQSDENLLRNIFVNLLTNAIKFSPGRGKVDLIVRKQDDLVVVGVRDYGLGISEADLTRVFEPFHRGSNVKEIKGTGLGLPIVKKAVETLGGDVTVQSELGIGTCFTVKLNIFHT